MFLFRATHGKVLAGSSSFASQTTTAAGRHVVGNPIRSSERYELTATSATSLNQARRVCSRMTSTLGVGQYAARSKPAVWDTYPGALDVPAKVGQLQRTSQL